VTPPTGAEIDKNQPLPFLSILAPHSDAHLDRKGGLLPCRTMSPDRFTHSVKVHAAPDHAWDVLQDPETWGLIAGVKRVYDARHFPNGTLRDYHFTVMAAGRAYEGTARTQEADEPSLMAVTIDTSEVMGTITVELGPGNPGGTDLTASLKMQPRGLLSALVFPIIARAVGSGFAEQIEGIATRMEQG
jgi:carbon monoxide dehydrogenase subunit G